RLLGPPQGLWAGLSAASRIPRSMTTKWRSQLNLGANDTLSDRELNRAVAGTAGERHATIEKSRRRADRHVLAGAWRVRQRRPGREIPGGRHRLRRRGAGLWLDRADDGLC